MSSSQKKTKYLAIKIDLHCNRAVAAPKLAQTVCKHNREHALKC